MRYYYKKPGAWTWTQHDTDSLEADLAAGRIDADWRIRPDGDSAVYLPHELIAAEAAARKQAAEEVHSALGTQGRTKPKRGMFKALSIYLIVSFLWRALTTAHEYPSPSLRNMTIALDLLCVIGLSGTGIQIFKDNPPGQSTAEKVLFWLAFIAGLGLFAIRLNGNASWWTGHLTYELSPPP